MGPPVPGFVADYSPFLLEDEKMSQRKRGRPAALDNAKQDVIVGMLSLGCTRAAAARYLGCAPETVRKTAKRDDHFAERMRQAEMNLEMKHMSNLVNASGRSWRASAWALERLNPKRFGRRRPDAFSPDQIKGLIDYLGKLLGDEVPETPTRDRICDRLEQVVQRLDSITDDRLPRRRRAS